MRSVVAPRPGAAVAIVRERLVRSVFQPLVELETGRVVGYEALARGPAGTRLESPAALFAAAADGGWLAELDWRCRASAVEAAAAAGLAAPFSLFVNVEPETVGSECPDDLQPLLTQATSFPVVLEITERALLERPRELLRAVANAREQGSGIAIDDVGADPRSLALMPFLEPDVIKLDLQLIQGRPTREVALTVNAVRAEAERTGAAILAEGIETHAHEEIALSIGATIGQGYLYGRPGALIPTLRVGKPLRLRPNGGSTEITPFQLMSERCDVRRSAKPFLIEVSKQLEAEALALGETAVVLAAFQHERYLTAKTRVRYGSLAENLAFIGVLGNGITAEPLSHVRGADLAPDDPLIDEWNIAVVAPHFAACLTARDLGDLGPEDERRFDYALTFRRELAVAAATAMLNHF